MATGADLGASAGATEKEVSHGQGRPGGEAVGTAVSGAAATGQATWETAIAGNASVIEERDSASVSAASGMRAEQQRELRPRRRQEQV